VHYFIKKFVLRLDYALGTIELSCLTCSLFMHFGDAKAHLAAEIIEVLL
jgi:hypothetical protein